MGTQFSQTIDLLIITANEIAYPQNAPANKPSIKNNNSQQQERKYGWLDYRNLTDNQGKLPIQFDYTRFIPKKYYKDSSNEQIQAHLKMIQKKQALLKRFKHHEDFDRIQYDGNGFNYSTFQTNIEKGYVTHFILTAIASRILTVQVYYTRYSHTLWRAGFIRLYLMTLPFPFLACYFTQQAQPINHQYFRTMPKQVRMYQSLAYDLDTFQYVNDIKYNFKYPERKEYKQTLKNVRTKINQNMYQDSVRYYKKIYGIVQAQPYLNKKPKLQTLP